MDHKEHMKKLEELYAMAVKQTDVRTALDITYAMSNAMSLEAAKTNKGGQ